MRGSILAFAGALALAVTAQAAPLAPKPVDAVTYLPGQEWVPLSDDFSGPSLISPPRVELVSGGCGWGWHRVHWQDHWGHWHWHCAPYPHAYHGRTNLEHPYADWRGPTGGWGNP
jgi:hypothetical protein